MEMPSKTRVNPYGNLSGKHKLPKVISLTKISCVHYTNIWKYEEEEGSIRMDILCIELLIDILCTELLMNILCIELPSVLMSDL